MREKSEGARVYTIYAKIRNDISGIIPEWDIYYWVEKISVPESIYLVVVMNQETMRFLPIMLRANQGVMVVQSFLVKIIMEEKFIKMFSQLTLLFIDIIFIFIFGFEFCPLIMQLILSNTDKRPIIQNGQRLSSLNKNYKLHRQNM